MHKGTDDEKICGKEIHMGDKDLNKGKIKNKIKKTFSLACFSNP